MPSFPLLKSLPLFTVKQESHPCRLHPTALEMLSHPPTPNTTNSHLPAIGLCSSWWQEANFGVRPRGTVILLAFFQYLLCARHGMAWAYCLNLSEPQFINLNPRKTLGTPLDGHVD